MNIKFQSIVEIFFLALGMGCLEVGLALHLGQYTNFVPRETVTLLSYAVQSVFQATPLWLYPMIPVLLAQALVVFAVGATALTVAPSLAKNWPISVVQFTLAISLGIPALHLVLGRQLTLAEDIVLRALGLESAGLVFLFWCQALHPEDVAPRVLPIALPELSVSPRLRTPCAMLKALWIVLIPLYWIRLWRGEFGKTLASSRGLLYLGLGYATSDTLNLYSPAMIGIGSGFLMRFAWLQAHDETASRKVRILGWLWFWLNAQYLTVFIIVTEARFRQVLGYPAQWLLAPAALLAVALLFCLWLRSSFCRDPSMVPWDEPNPASRCSVMPQGEKLGL